MMATFEDGGIDLDPNEVFVRNIYPQLAIKRWWADNLGVYDESTATDENRGTFLGQVHKNGNRYDYATTWKEIRKHIEEEMMYQFSGETQQQNRRPILGINASPFLRAKKAP